MDAGSDIQERIDRFKSDLRALNIDVVVRKVMLSRGSYILNEDLFFQLQEEIAGGLGVHPADVHMVGSAKLGFSIAPRKRYRPFGNTSDIDIAIVSTSLFEDIWYMAFDYRNQIGDWPREMTFKEYLFQGWIRPDKLPPADAFQISRDWWEFFRSLTRQGKYGPYRIKAGLYHSWRFLESYQTKAVQACKEDMELNG